MRRTDLSCCNYHATRTVLFWVPCWLMILFWWSPVCLDRYVDTYLGTYLFLDIWTCRHNYRHGHVYMHKCYGYVSLMTFFKSLFKPWLCTSGWPACWGRKPRNPNVPSASWWLVTPWRTNVVSSSAKIAGWGARQRTIAARCAARMLKTWRPPTPTAAAFWICKSPVPRNAGKSLGWSWSDQTVEHSHSVNSYW